MSTTPQYASGVRAAAILVSTANTNRDGSGTLVTLFSPNSQGSRVDDINITAIGTTTAGMIRLFFNDGAVNRLALEVPVTAVTPSNSVPAFSAQLRNLAWMVPFTWSIRASTAIGESFHITVTRAGDF